jgi:hypothetical protein
MVCSGSAAIATAISFGGPAWITAAFILFWGITIVPDSAQFSALVADADPPEHAGSVLTLQTALGFALTAVTVQIVPFLVSATRWPIVLGLLAIGPAFGIVAMTRLLLRAGNG